MKCDKCFAPSIIYQKYSGMHLCTAHLQEDVFRKMRGSLRRSGIFSHGAKIAVAMNGGAESSAMIYLLKSLFSDRKDIEFVAIMVDEGIAGYRDHALDCAIKSANELQIPFVIRHFTEAFGMSMDDLYDFKEPCSICGPMRNELLNGTAREVGANALAIGISLDAEAAEIMLGCLRGEIMGAHIRNTNEKIPIIKPLRRIPAAEVRLYARNHGICFTKTPCPYARGELMDVRKELRDFEERHPGTYYSLLRCLERNEKLRQIKDEEGQSL